MTGRNPNVYYEVGYARGFGKPVILITREAADIPFDLKHYPHVVYGKKISTLKDELKRRVQACIGNPELLKPKAARLATLASPEPAPLEIQVINYLRAKNKKMISFERMKSLMGIPEDQARSLIQNRPTKFRYALLKGDRPGIALIHVEGS